MDLTPIGFGASVMDADGRALEENALISAESAYTYMSERIRDCLFLPIVAVERDGILYALREKTGTQSEPVSYTHLDVYKRQVLVTSVVPPRYCPPESTSSIPSASSSLQLSGVAS